MLGGMLAIFAVCLFVCAFRAKKNEKEIGKVKPEDAKSMMIMAVVLLCVGIWMAAPSDEPSQGGAITDVLMTIPDSDSSVHDFVTGDLQGGVAVVINKSAGYWVKDGKVFAVNGIAANMSPGIEYAPQEIDWAKVEQATP